MADPGSPETPVPESAPESAKALSQLQRCIGASWVNFDTVAKARPATDIADGAPTPDAAPFSGSGTPELVCAGYRTSKTLQGVPGRKSDSDNDVTDDTKSLFCAGQLSMIMPSGAPSASSSPGVALGPLFRVRCVGVSVRFDTVMAENESEGSAQANTSAPQRHKEVPRSSVAEGAAARGAAGANDDSHTWTRSALRGAEAVADRASRMVSTVGEAASETSLKDFPGRTKEQTEKICSQAVKIAKRSGEHMQRVAMVPWRGFRGGDGEAQE